MQAWAYVCYDDDGNAYVNTNADRGIWKRYGKYCDDLRLLARHDGRIYTKEEAFAHYSVFDERLATIVSVPNIYKPRRNILNLKLRAESFRIIAEEVRNADRVIVRTPGFLLPNYALKMCRKYGKPYLIESIDFPSEMRMYSMGLSGMLKKLTAPYVEWKCKSEIARAPYVVYVTQRVLQERYPTNGKSIGCSDVELACLDDNALESRIERTRSTAAGRKVIFGTVGSLGSYIKGQEYVIRALEVLKSEGITDIEYHIVGSGKPDRLSKIARPLGVLEQVKFVGVLPHEEIFSWYDGLDVYIQPSLTESQCRSVIEAMSRACPAACSRIGGMQEYPDKDIMFTAKNVAEIAAVMKKLLDPEVRIEQARKSFAIAHDFERSKLDALRDEFYADFMGIKH